MIEIKHRFTGEVVFRSETAASVREAVLEAVRAGANLGSADLRSADLGYADLGSAYLGSADLRYADLLSADLRSADLGYANLLSANLLSANLGSADLRSADLRYADLGYANLLSANLGSADLRYADLRSADLRSADLRYANLGYANLYGTTCLSVTGLPSGHAILAPLPDGWRLTVGCWQGTVTELRDLIAQDDDWPEATGDQIAERRPMLAALADMCDAWTVTHQHVLDEVVSKWGNKVEAVAK